MECSVGKIVVVCGSDSSVYVWAYDRERERERKIGAAKCKIVKFCRLLLGTST
jgi:hypothetical protein